MTNFAETPDAAAFIESAQSRETSPEIMHAIAFFARNLTEAESLWSGDGIGTIATISDIWEHATGNGRTDDNNLMWGDRSLADIVAENA